MKWVPRNRIAPLAAGLVLLTACGDFSRPASSFTAQPSLSAANVTPVLPAQRTTDPALTPPSTAASSGGSTGGKPVDPCQPVDSAVIAACLAAPWGLVPLQDGQSALVGERTTGRILLVSAGKKPVSVATITGIDAAGDGGLLGLAVSPSYVEDGLIYAYVTTATDNRIVRIAAGDRPKAIFTGIPKGRTHNGGAIKFAGSDLYIGTGDVGRPVTSASLAGKVLRINESGKPVAADVRRGSAILAAGFTQVIGMCLLPNGSVGALDDRPAADVLLPVTAGRDYSVLKSGDALWTWKAGDGGAAGCSATAGVLANTSLDKQRLTAIDMTARGTFSGTPRVLLDRKYGRLRTLAPGVRDLLWMTTANKDGHGRPVPSDDRVIVLPSGGAGGGGGPE